MAPKISPCSFRYSCRGSTTALCRLARPIDIALASDAAVIAHARERLAAFKVPKAVFVVDQLPRNVMGKVEKNKLRAQYRDIFR